MTKFQNNLTDDSDGYTFASETARAELINRLYKVFYRTAKEVMEADISTEEKLECLDTLRGIFKEELSDG